MKAEKLCENCGALFLVKPSHLEKRRCCSRKCLGELRSKNAIGFDPERSLEKPCPVCGRLFRVKLSHVDKRTYCSRKCMASGYKDLLTGEDNPNYRGTTSKTCVACGKTFDSFKKTARYCSRQCSNAAPERKPVLRETIKKALKAAIVARGERKRFIQKRLPLSYDSRKRYTCPICGNEFWSYYDRITCSRKCQSVHNRKPVEKQCVICGKKMILSPSRAVQCETCSPECSSKWQSKRQKGSKSHLWKGGKTSKALIIRGSLEYVQWRKQVFARDNYTCQMCGCRGNKLSAHHIKPFRDHKELRLVIGNGITLCWPCHASIKGKEKQYEEQFFAITGGI